MVILHAPFVFINNVNLSENFNVKNIMFLGHKCNMIFPQRAASKFPINSLYLEILANIEMFFYKNNARKDPCINQKCGNIRDNKKVKIKCLF